MSQTLHQPNPVWQVKLAVMNMFRGFFIRIGCFFGAIEITKMHSNGCAEFDFPTALVASNAARVCSFFRGVHHLLCRCRFSQICKSVVSWITVDVVNRPRWPATGHNRVSYSVGSVMLAVDGSEKIPFTVWLRKCRFACVSFIPCRRDYIAPVTTRLEMMRGTLKPNKKSGVRVVFDTFKKIGDRYHATYLKILHSRVLHNSHRVASWLRERGKR